MSKREELAELKREMAVLWNTMKRSGNKHPEEHYMIKSYIEDIKKLYAQKYNTEIVKYVENADKRLSFSAMKEFLK